jgi:hypothetical protein
MSDIIPHTILVPTSTRRRRGPAARRTIIVDGKEHKPRDEVADKAGISHRGGARAWKHRTFYVAGVAYVDEQAALRDLVNPPARTARRHRNPRA